MQKIVLFIGQTNRPWNKPSKIPNLFMNRLLIEEDVGLEILKILEPKKEKHGDYVDIDCIDAGVKSMSESGKDDLEPHFIYSGDYWWRDDELKKIFLNKMRIYGIHSATLTLIYKYRLNLITKEKMKQAYKGELINDENWKNKKMCVNDDLETFFTNLLDRKEFKEDEFVGSFFTPKLTKKELKLVDGKDKDFMSSFVAENPDVDPGEMKESDSRSKYIHYRCQRWTYYLKLESTPATNEKSIKSCCSML